MRIWKGFLWPTGVLLVAILLAAAGLVLGIVRLTSSVRAHHHLEDGHAAIERGDAEAALAAFNRAIALDPRSLEARRRRARLLNRLGQSEAAIADCTAALDIAPQETEFLVLRAEAYAEQGLDGDRPDDLERACADANAALQLNPTRAAAFRQRSRARRGLLQEAGALADADEAVRLEPQNPQGYFTRGRAHAHQGEDAEAIRDFTETLRLDPQHARALAYRGVSRFELQDDVAARDDCERAVALAPQDAQVYLCRSLVYRHDRRHTNELVDLNRAVERKPHYVHARIRRALCHLYRHDVYRAMKDCEAALGLNPTSGLAHAVYAFCRVGRGQLRGARAEMDRALELRPTSGTIQVLQAGLYYLNSQPTDALKACDRTGAYDRYLGRHLDVLRALCHFQERALGQVLADCNRELKRDPKSIEGYVIRSVARAEQGDHAGAQVDWNHARLLSARAALMARADVYTDLARHPQAIADWTAVLDRDPNDVTAYLERAHAYLALHPPRAREALVDCQHALQLGPEDAYTYLLLTQVYDLLERRGDTITSATECLRRDPENGLALLLRARTLLLQQAFDPAITDASEALRMGMEGGLAYAVRGAAHAAKREHDQARADLTRAAELDDNFEELRVAHERQAAAERPLVPAIAWPKIELKPRTGAPLLGSPPEQPSEPFRWPSGAVIRAVAVLAAIVFVVFFLVGFRAGKH